MYVYKSICKREFIVAILDSQTNDILILVPPLADSRPQANYLNS